MCFKGVLTLLFGLWAVLRGHVGLTSLVPTFWLQDQPPLAQDAMNYYYMIIFTTIRSLYISIEIEMSNRRPRSLVQ